MKVGRGSRNISQGSFGKYPARFSATPPVLRKGIEDAGIYPLPRPPEGPAVFPLPPPLLWLPSWHVRRRSLTPPAARPIWAALGTLQHSLNTEKLESLADACFVVNSSLNLPPESLPLYAFRHKWAPPNTNECQQRESRPAPSRRGALAFFIPQRLPPFPFPIHFPSPLWTQRNPVQSTEGPHRDTLRNSPPVYTQGNGYYPADKRVIPFLWWGDYRGENRGRV